MAGITNQQDVLDTITKVSHFTLTRYANTAACTLVIYDIFLTIGDTVGYVWEGKLSLPKVLYYITRYSSAPLLLVVTHRIPLPLDDAYCRRLAWVAGAGQVLINGCSLFIMSLRVRALWQSFPAITLCIRVFYTLGWMSTLILVIFSLQSIQKYTVYYALADTCYVDNRIPRMFLVTLIPLAIDFVFTILVALKTYQNLQHIAITLLPPVFRVFIRDGILYFCTMTFLGTGNALIWALLPPTLMYFGLYIYFACMTTFICRFYVNLLKTADKQRAMMPSTLATTLQSRTRREQIVLGDGEFEVTESMIERHGFLHGGEDADYELHQDVAGPSHMANVPNMQSSSSLMAGQETGRGWAGEIRFLTDSERAIVQSKKRHEM